jgi:hypothetical protein
MRIWIAKDLVGGDACHAMGHAIGMAILQWYRSRINEDDTCSALPDLLYLCCSSKTILEHSEHEQVFPFEKFSC